MHQVKTYIALVLLSTYFSFGQENPDTNITRLTQDQLIAGEDYVIDTIIDGQAYFKKSIKALQSVDLPKVLQDDEFASNIDKKWLEELYSNTLFDTIYRDVSGLKYDAVYYPELTTDTLKARLARLNARTPFNVEYNPGLESVIKSFLKNRHQSFERLMGLSNFYFPMFERELDNQDIPLEMKYLAIVESALKPRARSRV
ncbi:MAG: lytic transglycosylase, partial [Olleya sp.]